MDHYCGQCGQAAVNDARFCMSCGDRNSPADPTARPTTLAVQDSGQISVAQVAHRTPAVSPHLGQLADPHPQYGAYPARSKMMGRSGRLTGFVPMRTAAAVGGCALAFAAWLPINAAPARPGHD